MTGTLRTRMGGTLIQEYAPKWAEDKSIASKTYNARSETLLQKASFIEATSKYQFGVIPVFEFYESKYIE